MKPLQIPRVRVDAKFFPLTGGYDTTTPPLVANPGTLRDVQNFECDINGGYTRIQGYERFDGRASPSDAIYYTLPATITGTWAVGDVLTGATSSATATLIASSTSGFVVTKKSGTFVANESLQIVGVTVATCTGGAYLGGDYNSDTDAQYLNLAADQYRALIGAIPGAGEILGVWTYNDVVYAFRNNAGATAAVMYRSSATGWQAVTLYNEVSFTAGSGDIDDGDTLTQGAVTATIKRVVITSGSLDTSDAAGRLIVTNPTGGNFAAGAATTNTAGALTLSGAQTAITLAPGGRYEFHTYNFGGATAQLRMFGCSGVNPAFEFDGTTYVPIRTGMADDTPDYICGHKNHLFLAFGHSLQHSGTGTPYAWNPILGADELTAGDTITGLMPQVGSTDGGALLVMTRNQAKMLYGNSSLDWSLENVQYESGCFPRTVQQAGNVIMLDDRGVNWFAASQVFGNFEQATISHKYRPWILSKKNKVNASCIVREKNQYRLFFTDKYALYITVSGSQVVGACPVLLGHKVSCICSREFSDGNERIFFGSDNGYVYELDKGTSLDGDNIVWWVYLAFNHLGSPRVTKQMRKAAIESSGEAFYTFNIGYQLGYGSSEIEQPDVSSITAGLNSFIWDNFTWDNFTWDGQALSPLELSMDGTAENVSLAITGESDYVDVFSITGVILHYTVRTRLR